MTIKAVLKKSKKNVYFQFSKFILFFTFTVCALEPKLKCCYNICAVKEIIRLIKIRRKAFCVASDKTDKRCYNICAVKEIIRLIKIRRKAFCVASDKTVK